MKEKEAMISIVTLNYNGLKYLNKTIPPILKLDYPNYEFIIVDNGSTDGSIEFIKNVQKKTKKPKIRLIENGENLGYSKGKNIGVKHARGEYVLLLDNDILISDSHFIGNISNTYNQLNEIAFLALLMVDKGKTKSKYYGIYYSFYGINLHRPILEVDKIVKVGGAINVGSFNGGAVFFKRAIWKRLGGYDDSQPIMLDDFDIGARAYVYGYKNYLYNNDILTHLGKEKDIDKKYFAWKFKYHFSGIARMIVKNYNNSNFIKRFPIFLLISPFIYLLVSMKKRNFYVFVSFIQSCFNFFLNLQDIIRQRKIIQSKRVIKDDIFLKIKPPKFD